MSSKVAPAGTMAPVGPYSHITKVGQATFFDGAPLPEGLTGMQKKV